MVVVGGVFLQAETAPASTPMVVVEGAFFQAATAPASTPADATVNVEERLPFPAGPAQTRRFPRTARLPSRMLRLPRHSSPHCKRSHALRCPSPREREGLWRLAWCTGARVVAPEMSVLPRRTLLWLMVVRRWAAMRLRRCWKTRCE